MKSAGIRTHSYEIPEQASAFRYFFWFSFTVDPSIKHSSQSNFLAAHLGGDSGSQGGAQQGTGARGEQYLDGPSRSHTLAAPKLLCVAGSSIPLVVSSVSSGKHKDFPPG